MVQRTRRRLAAVFSMIAGLWFTLAGGPAQGFSLFGKPLQTPRQTTPVKAVQAQAVSPDTVSTGAWYSPASDADSATAAAVVNVETIENADMRAYVSDKAVLQGMDPTTLNREFVNTVTIEYLMKEVETLKAQIR